MASFKIVQLRAPFLYPNFRRLFCSELFHRIGNYIAFTATSLSIEKLMGDQPFYFGLLGACITLPSLFLAPLAGTIVTKNSRVLVLRYIQIWYLVTSLVCGLILRQGYESLFLFLVVASLYGIAIAISAPVLSAFIRDVIVNEDDLASANGIGWSMLSAVVLFGSLLGAAILGKFGASGCFLVAAAFHVVAFFVLRRVTAGSNKTPDALGSEKHDTGFWFGLKYLASNPALLIVVLVEGLM